MYSGEIMPSSLLHHRAIVVKGRTTNVMSFIFEKGTTSVYQCTNTIISVHKSRVGCFIQHVTVETVQHFCFA